MIYYIRWLRCQHTLKVVIEKHGVDSEEAKTARRELDAAYETMVAELTI